MSFLTEPLPTKINELGVKTDFRTWLRVADVLGMVEETRLVDRLYFREMMDDIGDQIYFPNEWPEYQTTELFRAILDFYTCDSLKQINPSKASGTKKDIVYDFSFDAGAIFASFLQQYGINLLRIKTMHWFEFSILLQNLGENTPFRERIKIRKLNANEVARDKLKDLKALQTTYRLPVSEVEQDRKTQLTKFLQGGK